MRESVSPRDARPAECASRSLTSSAPAAAGPPGPPACPACSAPLPPPPPQSQLGTAPSPPHRRTWPPWPLSTVPPDGACAPAPGHTPHSHAPASLPGRATPLGPGASGARRGSGPRARRSGSRLRRPLAWRRARPSRRCRRLPSAPNPRPNGAADGGQTASGVETAQRIQRTGVRTLDCAFNGHLKEYTVFSILMTFH